MEKKEYIDQIQKACNALAKEGVTKGELLDIITLKETWLEKAKRGNWNKVYNQYLKSPQWQRIRKQVFERSNGMCEICEAPAKHCHHMNYLSVFDEELGDLQALCAQCHKDQHSLKEVSHEKANRRTKRFEAPGGDIALVRQGEIRKWKCRDCGTFVKPLEHYSSGHTSLAKFLCCKKEHWIFHYRDKFGLQIRTANQLTGKIRSVYASHFAGCLCPRCGDYMTPKYLIYSSEDMKRQSRFFLECCGSIKRCKYLYGDFGDPLFLWQESVTRKEYEDDIKSIDIHFRY